MREHHAEYVKDIKNKDAEQKRQMRSKLSPVTKMAERKKDADRKYVDRHVVADMYPEHHAYMKERHAQQDRDRRVADPEIIKEAKKHNNRMRMRTIRQGKKGYYYMDLNKVRMKFLNSADNDGTNSPKKRCRRSPETRKIHAAQQRKRMASLSPNSAAKAREIKAKRERERRAAKSDDQRKRDRYKNAARMRDKRATSKVHQPAHDNMVQQSKCMASLSADNFDKVKDSAAKVREAMAKREEETKAAKSEAERKRDRHRNAARMEDKQAIPKLDEPIHCVVRQNFTINWRFDWRSQDRNWDYYTIINDNEYIQYKMHGLMLKDVK